MVGITSDGPRRPCRPILPIHAGSAPPGVPGHAQQDYTLDSGDKVRIIVFSQDNP
jgi:protein involved in polysaccharide export with SLBB domain